MYLFKSTNQQFTQMLIPERFIPSTPPEHGGKNMVYIFDSYDKFELTKASRSMNDACARNIKLEVSTINVKH